MKNKILVGIEEIEDKFNIKYYCAESEEEFYNGNHDVSARWSINKDLLNNPEDEKELIEMIKLYDANFDVEEVIIVS